MDVHVDAKHLDQYSSDLESIGTDYTRWIDDVQKWVLLQVLDGVFISYSLNVLAIFLYLFRIVIPCLFFIVPSPTPPHALSLLLKPPKPSACIINLLVRQYDIIWAYKNGLYEKLGYEIYLLKFLRLLDMNRN